MLDLAEKIVMGISALLVAATVAFYLFLGFPSTASLEFIQPVQDEPAPKAAAPAPQAGTPEAPQPVTPQDQEIIKKLADQGIRVPAGQGILKERKMVPRELFEYVSKEANYMSETKLVRATVMPGNTRLKLAEIQPSSLLKKVGLQKGDIIELIDGEILEFSDSKSFAYHTLFKSKIQKVREGQPISITITRNNRPLQIFYRL